MVTEELRYNLDFSNVYSSTETGINSGVPPLVAALLYPDAPNGATGVGGSISQESRKTIVKEEIASILIKMYSTFS